MTITINSNLLFYFVFAIVFQTIYSYFSFKIQWRKFKSNAGAYAMFVMMKTSFKSSSSGKLLLKTMFNPITYGTGYLLFCMVSPILFPLSLASLLRRLIFGKTKLQKEADQEEKSIATTADKHENFVREEGVYFPHDDNPIEIFNSHKQ